MNTWISQAVAEEHRRDLLRTADVHRRYVAARRSRPTPVHASWDARLGWLLIRVGCRLVALRATPANATAVHSA